MAATISGRSLAAGITASTEPTATARWMSWMPSNSAATSLIFSARASARSAASSTPGRALGAASGGDPLVERPDRGSGGGALVDLAGEHHRRGGRAADAPTRRSPRRPAPPGRVERLGEHDERAAVVAGDDAEHDRAVEVDDRPADLRAVLQLQAAHRLRRAVEAGQVGQHDQRPVAAGGVDRPRDLLRRQREQRAGRPGVRAVGGRKPRRRHGLRLDADEHTG